MLHNEATGIQLTKGLQLQQQQSASDDKGLLVHSQSCPLGTAALDWAYVMSSTGLH